MNMQMQIGQLSSSRSTNAYIGTWLNEHKQYDSNGRVVRVVAHDCDAWDSEPDAIAQAIIGNYPVYKGQMQKMINIILNEHDGWSDWDAETDFTIPPVWIPFGERVIRTSYSSDDVANIYIHRSSQYRVLNAAKRVIPVSNPNLEAWANSYKHVREVHLVVWGSSGDTEPTTTRYHRIHDEFNGLLYISKYAPLSKTQRGWHERWFNGNNKEQGHYYKIKPLEKGVYLFLIDPSPDNEALSVYYNDGKGPHYGFNHVSTQGLYDLEYRPDPMDKRSSKSKKGAGVTAAQNRKNNV